MPADEENLQDVMVMGESIEVTRKREREANESGVGQLEDMTVWKKGKLEEQLMKSNSFEVGATSLEWSQVIK